MNKKEKHLSWLILSLIFIMAACGNNSRHVIDGNDEDSVPLADSVSEDPASETKDNLPPGVKALIESYPDFIVGYENGEIIYKDGDRQVYDDGIDKSFDQLLDNSSLKDMFYVAYTPSDSVPGYLQDAGRSRNEYLFKKMYGGTQAEASGNLITVDWFGQKLPFTKINGGADRLKEVAAELAQNPELKKYLKSAGTFYWRKVRGANRQSAHSYGIAIDVGVDYSDYWLWKYPGAKETDTIKYVNRMPKEIVEIFKKHGFIWGGGWYHFDTMHFEYRPEILAFSE